MNTGTFSTHDLIVVDLMKISRFGFEKCRDANPFDFEGIRIRKAIAQIFKFGVFPPN
jgi:hypothetical protein